MSTWTYIISADGGVSFAKNDNIVFQTFPIPSCESFNLRKSIVFAAKLLKEKVENEEDDAYVFVNCALRAIVDLVQRDEKNTMCSFEEIDEKTMGKEADKIINAFLKCVGKEIIYTPHLSLPEKQRSYGKFKFTEDGLNCVKHIDLNKTMKDLSAKDGVWAPISSIY